MQKRHIWIEPAIATCAVVLLLVLSYQILAPFIAALVWGGILVYAAWGPYMRLVGLMRGNRSIPALLMLLIFSLLILVPTIVAGLELSSNIDEITSWVQAHVANGLPHLPQWVSGLPWVGPKIDAFWAGLGSGDTEVVNRVKEWLKPVGQLLLTFGAAVGSGLLLMLLSLMFAFFFFISGQDVVRWIMNALHRIGGERAQELMRIAGHTVRGVVYGFLGTALVQGALAWFGYLLSGVPNAPALGLVTCFLSLIPGGPSLLGLPAALWLYQQGHTGWAIFLAIWMLGVVSMADNVVKPLFIGKGSDLPFILILVGVMGGAFAWGMLGVFLGPTLLAVSYALLQYWAKQESAALPPIQPATETPAPPAGH
ncbi:AI-2E family transporter [Andreprevotia chitinilytica]|uniref:AI-2E family transporter n=1 Tax=Andreprevotia chitinilytica TaxID=396808 RepID=UPI00054E3673|nr:AI-2E family transporter [Andreprevotia chitinilytica]